MHKFGFTFVHSSMNIAPLQIVAANPLQETLIALGAMK
jgi:hypothetical protein